MLSTPFVYRDLYTDLSIDFLLHRLLGDFRVQLLYLDRNIDII